MYVFLFCLFVFNLLRLPAFVHCAVQYVDLMFRRQLQAVFVIHGVVFFVISLSIIYLCFSQSTLVLIFSLKLKLKHLGFLLRFW